MAKAPSTVLDVNMSLANGRGAAPAGGGSAVTVSDSTADPSGPFRFLFVSSAGAIKVTTLEGDDLTLTVIASQYVWVAVSRVWSTGTTVTSPNTNIIGFR